jgi:glycosyltransferase involved in cell wall biosynthesis
LATPEPYSGSSVARNIGLESLNTSYIAFLDDDNLMFPSWLEKAAGFLSKDEKIDILYGAQLRDDAQLTTVKNWFFEPFDFQRLKQGNFIDLN